MKPIFLACFLVCMSAAAMAQAPDFRRLDRFISALDKRGLINGSLVISQGEKLLYNRSAGFSVRDSNGIHKPDAGTVYRVGSVTKMFTAVMVFQLVEENALRLEDTLSAFFPKLPNAAKITIAQLLQHSSGLPDYTADPHFQEWMDRPQTHAQMLERIEGMAPLYAPGGKPEYCNTNYLLLGYIVERVGELDYSAALKQRITDRLGLQHTYFGHPIDVARNEARSYKYNSGKWVRQKETDMGIHEGAGSVMSTPGDLVLFMEGLYTGKLLRVQAVNEMMGMKDGYGKGLFPYDYGFIKGFGHNGRIEEFYSAVRYFPEKKLAIAYVTNGILYPRNDIIDVALKACFNDSFDIPFEGFKKPGKDSLLPYAGVYISPDLPFKVNCQVKDGRLLIEAAGKSMKAEPVSRNYFMDLVSGSFFVFDPGSGSLQVKETDNVYNFRKE